MGKASPTLIPQAPAFKIQAQQSLNGVDPGHLAVPDGPGAARIPLGAK